MTFYDSAVKIRDKLTGVKVDTGDLKPLEEFSGKVHHNCVYKILTNGCGFRL